MCTVFDLYGISTFSSVFFWSTHQSESGLFRSKFGNIESAASGIIHWAQSQGTMYSLEVCHQYLWWGTIHVTFRWISIQSVYSFVHRLPVSKRILMFKKSYYLNIVWKSTEFLKLCTTLVFSCHLQDWCWTTKLKPWTNMIDDGSCQTKRLNQLLFLCHHALFFFLYVRQSQAEIVESTTVLNPSSILMYHWWTWCF